MRFVAIALVLLCHVGVVMKLTRGIDQVTPPFGSMRERTLPTGILQRFAVEGRVGVFIFFIISGFVLALPFIEARVAGTRQPVGLRRFYVRRVTRIEPPYVVSMLLVSLLALATTGAVGARHLVAGLLYVHQPIYNTPNTLNSVAWSLEVEVQWYLVVPLFAVLLTRGSARQRRLTVLLIATSMLCLQYLTPTTSVLGTAGLLGYLQFFLAGWLLADVYVVDWRSTQIPSHTWDGIGLVAWVSLFVLLTIAESTWRFTVPIAGTLGCAAALRGSLARRIFRSGWIAVIGGMCYSIYLTHYPLFVLAAKVAGTSTSGSFTLSFFLWTVTLVPLAIVVGGAYFVLIEKPCMDPSWPRELAGRLRTTRWFQGGLEPWGFPIFGQRASSTAQ